MWWQNLRNYLLLKSVFVCCGTECSKSFNVGSQNYIESCLKNFLNFLKRSSIATHCFIFLNYMEISTTELYIFSHCTLEGVGDEAGSTALNFLSPRKGGKTPDIRLLQSVEKFVTQREAILFRNILGPVNLMYFLRLFLTVESTFLLYSFPFFLRYSRQSTLPRLRRAMHTQ